MKNDKDKQVNRRQFFHTSIRTTTALGIGAAASYTVQKSTSKDTVWQLDPNKCVQCERCMTNCVLSPSAVKCVHVYDLCGYCELCGGYFQPNAMELNTAAENQLCPTSAIKRTFIEDPYYKYDLEEKLCVGCGKCVKGCNSFGNGSLQLQVRHDRCVNCNECTIARDCPADAFQRVSADQPYLLRGIHI